jgi:hypothetical protein
MTSQNKNVNIDMGLIILGSGFSKALANLPTLTNLRQEVTNYIQNIENKPSLNYAKSFLRICDEIFPWADYEELMTIAWNIGQYVAWPFHEAFAFSSFVVDMESRRYLLEDNWVEPIDVQNSLAFAQALYLAILEEDAKVEINPMGRKFIKLLSNGGIILTINYDTVIERLLEAEGIDFSYDFWDLRGWHSRHTAKIEYYKLHGSNNWFPEKGKYPLPFSIEPTIALERIKRGDIPSIIPPTPGKAFFLHPFEESWKSVAVKAQQYRTITFIGCGFAQTDPEFRVLLRQISHLIRIKKGTLNVIDIGHKGDMEEDEYRYIREQQIKGILSGDNPNLLDRRGIQIEIHYKGLEEWLNSI